MSSVILGSRSRTNSARRKESVTTAIPPARADASTAWSQGQQQRELAKQNALAKLKLKPTKTPA